MKTKPKPGDKFWFVSDANVSRSFEITVKTVGRKWVMFEREHFRAHVDTMQPEILNGAGVGRIYASQAAFEAERATDQKWFALHRKVADHWQRPGHVTAEVIDQAMSLLFPA